MVVLVILRLQKMAENTTFSYICIDRGMCKLVHRPNLSPVCFVWPVMGKYFLHFWRVEVLTSKEVGDRLSVACEAKKCFFFFSPKALATTKSAFDIDHYSETHTWCFWFCFKHWFFCLNERAHNIFHAVVHFPSGCSSSQGCARPKPGTKNFFQVS